jgi:protease-4
LIAGKNKAMGYPFVKSNPVQQIMQQKMLDEVHQQFIDAVKNGRKDKLKLSDPDLFSGRYWIGQDAVGLGLIDGFATVDTIARNQFGSENIVDFTPVTDSLVKLSKKFGVELMDGAKQSVLTDSRFNLGM